MFVRILVPLDLTGSHSQVLDVAARLAREGGGVLTLVHVIRLIPGLLVEDEQAFYASLDRKTRKHLAGIAADVAARGADCAVEVRFGDPAREIVRLCEEARADLVVMDSHRVDGPGAPGWGTLSYKVGVLSPCPVLLVNPEYARGFAGERRVMKAQQGLHVERAAARPSTHGPGRDPRSRRQGEARSVGFVKPRKGLNAAAGPRARPGADPRA